MMYEALKDLADVLGITSVINEGRISFGLAYNPEHKKDAREIAKLVRDGYKLYTYDTLKKALETFYGIDINDRVSNYDLKKMFGDYEGYRIDNQVYVARDAGDPLITLVHEAAPADNDIDAQAFTEALFEELGDFHKLEKAKRIGKNLGWRY